MTSHPFSGKRRQPQQERQPWQPPRGRPPQPTPSSKNRSSQPQHGPPAKRLMPRSTERLLRRVLKQTTDGDPIWRERNDEAAKGLGVDRSTVVRSVARLREAGLLQPLHVEGGRGRPSEYRVDRAGAAVCLKRGRLPKPEPRRKPHDNARPQPTAPSRAPDQRVSSGVKGPDSPSSDLRDRLLGMTLGAERRLSDSGASLLPAGTDPTPLGPTWLGRQWEKLGRDGQWVAVSVAFLGVVAGAGIGGAVRGPKGAIIGGLLGGVVGAGLSLALAPDPPAPAAPATPLPTVAPVWPPPESGPADALIDWIARSAGTG